MTRVLHTADLHLRQEGDERWEALEELLARGRDQGVDALAISGDLLDRDVDAERLRDPLRRLFADNGFPVVILPGNHDGEALGRGRFLGPEAVVLDDPGLPLELPGFRLWGLPFADGDEMEVLRRLRGHFWDLPGDGCNYLLYHGELLDAFFSRREMGDEGQYTYMPVQLSHFSGLPLQGVLAGHLHSRPQIWQLQQGGYFAYPGSPVSITRREAGQRVALLWETDRAPRELPLNTFHHQELRVQLDPFAPEDPLDLVEEALREAHPRARVSVRLEGWLDGARLGWTETDLVEALQAQLGSRAELVSEFRDVGILASDVLARAFLNRLESVEVEEELRERMRQMAIRAMLETGLCG